MLYPCGSRATMGFNKLGYVILAAACIAFFNLTFVAFRGSDGELWKHTHFDLSYYATTLASRQSLGFFDDIPDETWKRMQAKARSFVQFTNRSLPENGFHKQPLQQRNWYEQNLQPDFTCPHIQRVGGHGDGPKWTCDPHRLLKRKDCLVYSVGSNGDYTFEDAMVELLDKQCEIHVFDPDDYARPNDSENKNIHFHQWALASSEAESGPNKKSFPEILKVLGHESRTIDILKIDCEFCEWYVFYHFIFAAGVVE